MARLVDRAQAEAIGAVTIAAIRAQHREDQAQAARYDWRAQAREKQLPPDGEWSNWLVLAGRGFGKTRTGAEFIREEVRERRMRRIALVGRTAADVRDVMVEGESGILNITPPSERPIYEPSKRRLTWPNGARATTFSADKPDMLRGPEHDGYWADELAAWRFGQDAWDNLEFGLRRGKNPRGIVTTTPKPTKLIRELLADPKTHPTRGSTFENEANLAQRFIDRMRRRYEGTRLGRQELMGEILDDTPGALWTRARLELLRVREPPEMVRIVVGVDPAASSGDDADETGIVVCGLGVNGHGYVLDDRTVQGTPLEWATAAVDAYREHRADRLVAEVNNGGEMVGYTVATVDPSVAFKAVWASRGKRTRAEPIAALDEKGLIHHVGYLAELEDQLCLAAGTLVTTLLGDIPVEDVIAGDQVLTRDGWRAVSWSGCTGNRRLVTVRTDDGRTLRCTADHPIHIEGRGFVPAGEVHTADIITICHSRSGGPSSTSTASATSSKTTATTARAALAAVASCIETSTRLLTALFRRAPRSITATTIAQTTIRPTWKLSAEATTSSPTVVAVRGPNRATCARPSGVTSGPGVSPARWSAPSAGLPSIPLVFGHGFARACVVSVTEESGLPEPVFDLTVEDAHEFFANGILVHNCTWKPGEDSPDRLDARVWALTELFLEPDEAEEGSAYYDERVDISPV